MLTAVPAEGYLALRQHRILLCAAPIFFQGCVSPLPCPHSRWGLFVYRLQRVPLSERVRGRLLQRVLAAGSGTTKNTHRRRLWLGSIIIGGCSQCTAKRMIQQHTGDNIPIGVHRTVSDRLRYPLLSYQLFQRIHLLFQKVKRYLWIDLVIQLRSNKPADNLCFRKQIVGRPVLPRFLLRWPDIPCSFMIRQLSAPTFMTLSISDWSSRLARVPTRISSTAASSTSVSRIRSLPKVDLDFFFFHSHHPLVTGTVSPPTLPYFAASIKSRSFAPARSVHSESQHHYHGAPETSF